MRDDAGDIAPIPAAPDAPEATATPQGDGAASADMARLTDEIVTAIKTVYDPEIPADVYELGLIYRIDIADDRSVNVDMTLTTPNCPSAQELPTMVENAVASVIEEGKYVTYDLKADRNDPTAVGTREMAEAICSRL